MTVPVVWVVIVIVVLGGTWLGIITSAQAETDKELAQVKTIANENTQSIKQLRATVEAQAKDADKRDRKIEKVGDDVSHNRELLIKIATKLEVLE